MGGRGLLGPAVRPSSRPSVYALPSPVKCAVSPRAGAPEVRLCFKLFWFHPFFCFSTLVRMCGSILWFSAWLHRTLLARHHMYPLAFVLSRPPPLTALNKTP